MTEQAIALRRVFADTERLRCGGYDVIVAGKKVIVKKDPDKAQEKGIYNAIVNSWDADDEFAIRTLFKIYKRRDKEEKERKRHEESMERRKLQDRAISSAQEKINDALAGQYLS